MNVYHSCPEFEIESILQLIVQPSFDMFGCDKIVTKAIPSVTERIKALSSYGFSQTQEKLIGWDGTQYDSYFVLNK